jgi:hypothetical protein
MGDPIIVSLFIIAGCALVSFLMVWGMVFYALNPQIKQRKALQRLAHQDYQNARGTAHLKLLQQGRNRLQSRLVEVEKKIKAGQKTLDMLAKQEREQLKLALERHIVQTYLNIPGIGARLRDSLIYLVNQGRLHDLTRASLMIKGIGEARQAAINAWLRQWEERIPELLEKDFPEKNKIVKDIASRREKAQAEMSEASIEKEALTGLLYPVDKEILRLKRVKVKHFSHAMLGPGETNYDLNHYIQGVFAEWEPMPEWFKQMLSLEEA